MFKNRSHKKEDSSFASCTKEMNDGLLTKSLKYKFKDNQQLSVQYDDGNFKFAQNFAPFKQTQDFDNSLILMEEELN